MFIIGVKPKNKKRISAQELNAMHDYVCVGADNTKNGLYGTPYRRRMGIGNMKNLLKIYSLLALVSVLVGMLLISVPWQNLPSKDAAVVATFLLNGFLWGGMLFYELTKRAYSLLIVHWLFCFLFFFCIAFVQYVYGVFPLIVNCGESLLLLTNLLLFAWTVFVWIGYKISVFKGGQSLLGRSARFFQIPTWLIVGLSCFSAGNMIYRIATIGFTNLLARATALVSYGTEYSAVGLIIRHTFQAFSFFAVVFSLFFYRQRRKGFIFVVITFVCLLVSYFPTALSRNAAAVIYGGLLLLVFRSLRTNRLFVCFLLGGFLILLPFLNAFRNTSFLDIDLLNSFGRVFEHLADEWLSGDYDAYAMLNLVLEHIRHYGITWGMQFLGILLFWVPRAWWITKPIGTGAFVATQLGWSFTNLSAPLPAEGLINFGIGGYLLFAVVVGAIIGKLDKAYWNDQTRKEGVFYPYDVLYPVLIMFFFFMNRGDLLSSTAYTMAYVVVWGVLCGFCMRKKLHNR